jgi:penicillin-binding protein 1A
VLYEHASSARGEGVIGQPALGYMIEMMRQVLISGTGQRARIGGYDLAGKTGTTSDYKDAWFIGYTGGFTAAVWVGRDDDTPMRRVTGGGAPAEIWRSFMAAALPRLQAQTIPGGAAPSDAGDAIGNVLAGQPPAGATPATPPPDEAPPETPTPAAKPDGGSPPF